MTDHNTNTAPRHDHFGLPEVTAHAKVESAFAALAHIEGIARVTTADDSGMSFNFGVISSF